MENQALVIAHIYPPFRKESEGAIPPFIKGVRGIMLFYNKNLKGYSRQLRTNMTNAERLLWSKVRRKQLQGYHFYRQKIIGNYIVDFYCPKAKLGVEIDGGQHYDHDEIKKDNVRDDYMREQRLTVLRFSDREIFENLDGVIERINEEL